MSFNGRKKPSGKRRVHMELGVGRDPVFSKALAIGSWPCSSELYGQHKLAFSSSSSATFMWWHHKGGGWTWEDSEVSVIGVHVVKFPSNQYIYREKENLEHLKGWVGTACKISCITEALAPILGLIPADTEGINTVGLSIPEKGTSLEGVEKVPPLHIVMSTRETLNFLHSSRHAHCKKGWRRIPSEGRPCRHAIIFIKQWSSGPNLHGLKIAGRLWAVTDRSVSEKA